MNLIRLTEISSSPGLEQGESCGSVEIANLTKSLAVVSLLGED